MAVRYGKRPSEFLGYEGSSWMASAIDCACFDFGMKAKLAIMESKGALPVMEVG